MHAWGRSVPLPAYQLTCLAWLTRSSLSLPNRRVVQRDSSSHDLLHNNNRSWLLVWYYHQLVDNGTCDAQDPARTESMWRLNSDINNLLRVIDNNNNGYLVVRRAIHNLLTKPQQRARYGLYFVYDTRAGSSSNQSTRHFSSRCTNDILP